MRKRVTAFRVSKPREKIVLHASFKSLARHPNGVFLFLRPGWQNVSATPDHGFTTDKPDLNLTRNTECPRSTNWSAKDAAKSSSRRSRPRSKARRSVAASACRL